jgi:hypothetical protein
VLTEDENKEVDSLLPKCKELLLGNEVAQQLFNAGLVNEKSLTRFEFIIRNCAMDYVISSGE